MEALRAYFDQLPLRFDPEFYEDIALFQQEILEKGDYYLRESQTAQKISFIVKGQIRHYYNVDGQEYTRWVSLSNNFVTAFTSFVREKPSLENLECIEPAVLLTLNRPTFYNLMEKHSGLRQLWIYSLEEEMVGYENRVCQLITTDSTKRYLDFIERYPRHSVEVQQKYIASMMGIAPRHLSRIRKGLAKGN